MYQFLSAVTRFSLSCQIKTWFDFIKRFQRDRETDRRRETERQRDRETERQRDRETDRQTDRTERQRDGERPPVMFSSFLTIFLPSLSFSSGLSSFSPFSSPFLPTSDLRKRSARYGIVWRRNPEIHLQSLERFFVQTIAHHHTKTLITSVWYLKKRSISMDSSFSFSLKYHRY